MEETGKRKQRRAQVLVGDRGLGTIRVRGSQFAIVQAGRPKGRRVGLGGRRTEVPPVTLEITSTVKARPSNSRRPQLKVTR